MQLEMDLAKALAKDLDSAKERETVLMLGSVLGSATMLESELANDLVSDHWPGSVDHQASANRSR